MPTPIGALKRSAIGAAWWTGAQNAADEALRLVIFLLLARLLSPHIYGLMALVGVYLAVVKLCVDQGFSRALIQREDLRPEHLDTAFWSQMAIALSLCAFGVVAATQIAAALRQPELAPVLRAMALLTPLQALNTVQLARFERDFQARRFAAATLGGSLAGGALALAMAQQGFGLWSLVAQQLGAAVINATIVWRLSSWRPRLRFSRTAFDDLFGFSRNLLGLSVLQFLAKQGDKLLVGLVLGPIALGLYATAQRLIETIVQVAVRPLSKLGLPVLSRLQSDPGGLCTAFHRLQQVTSALAFPVFAGLFALAPEIVALVLGPKWGPVAPLLSILAAMGAFHALALIDAALIVSQGHTLLRLKMNAVYLLGAFLVAFVFVHFGIEAMTVAVVAAAFVFLPFELRQALRIARGSAREMNSRLWPVVLASALMLAAMLSALAWPLAGLPGWERVALAAPLGALVYAAALAVASPSLVRWLLQLRRVARGAAPDMTARPSG